MKKFKVGDWIVLIYESVYSMKPSIVQYTGKQNLTEDPYIKKVEPWRPQEGEWCWFWWENCNPELTKFIRIDDDNGDYIAEDYEGSIHYRPNVIEKSYQYCEPFIGTLPSFAKD